jgi:hypothetical protein
LLVLAAACTHVGDDELFVPHDAGPVPLHVGPFYYEDVAPITVKHCLPCHSGTSVGPIALVNLADARRANGNIYHMITSHLMPPFKQRTDGTCGVFRSPNPISSEQIQTLIDWYLHGSQAGNPNAAPPPWTPPPRLTTPSVTLAPSAPYTPINWLYDDWRCFVVDPGLASDAFLTAWDVNAGDGGTVQEITLYQLGSDAAAATAEALDAGDPLSGYACFGGSGTGDDAAIAAWRADQGMVSLDAGTGVHIHAGRKMVMQVHYVLENGAHPDTSALLLALSPSVANEMTPLVVSDRTLSLPAGEARALASATAAIPADGYVRGITPRMGKYGRTIGASLRLSGNDSCISDIEYWDPGWRSLFLFAAPIPVHAGDSVSVGCTYDTTSADVPVPYGETLDDEMCQVTVFLTRT